MGGIMWVLRWLAAGVILANCVMMTVDASLEAASFADRPSKPLITQTVNTQPVEVR